MAVGYIAYYKSKIYLQFNVEWNPWYCFQNYFQFMYFRTSDAVFSWYVLVCGDSTCSSWNNAKSWPPILSIFKTASKCPRSVKVDDACSAFFEEDRSVIPCDRLFIPFGAGDWASPLRLLVNTSELKYLLKV